MFCPQCGQKLKREVLGGFERGVCTTGECGYIHWDNPTPVVAAVVEYNNGIILARNVLWQPGSFALITGFLEKNEDPAEAVVREVKEELDLDALAPPRFHRSLHVHSDESVDYCVSREGSRHGATEPRTG